MHLILVIFVFTLCFACLTANSPQASDTKANQEDQHTDIQPPVPTTPEVATAMREIRAIVRNNHSLVTHRRLGVAQAQTMAHQIKKHTAGIRTSKTSAKLKATLAPILEAIDTGISAIATPTEKSSRIEGLFQIDKALNNYGTAVTDPQWRSLRAQ